jgi:hypothetical protein
MSAPTPVPPAILYQLDRLHEDRTAYFVVSVSVVVGLATVAVLLRFVARLLKKVPLWLDDYTIIVALVCAFRPSQPRPAKEGS